MEVSSQKNTPSIKKNFILSTLYEILTVLAPFITAPYISRVLGASNIGIYSYTSSVEMYFSLFAVMGTASYGKREIARTRDNKTLNSKYFWEIEILSILTSFIALSGWGLFVYFSNNYKIYYLILSINIFSQMFDISWFYKGLELFKYTVTRNTFVKLAGILILFIFVKTPEDLWIYFLCQVGISFLGNLSMWITLPRFISKVNPKEFKFRHHFKETLIYFVPTIATSIYTVLDKTLIGIITKSPEQNGFYEQATKIIKISKTFCFSSLNAIMGSRAAYLFEQQKYDEIKNKISKSINIIFFMSAGSCFGLLGISSRFVPLFYGKGYDEVIPILMCLSPILLITGISTCLNDMYFTPFGLRKLSAKYVIIGAFVNLILNIIFIPHFKALGAVFGTLIAEAVIMILYLLNCNCYLPVKVIIKSLWKKITAGIIMLGIIFLINQISANDIIILSAEIMAGTIIYVLILAIFKDECIGMITEKFKKKKL